MANKSTIPATCWPTATHELLLKAALINDKSAQTAWQHWLTQVDFFQDSLGGGDYQLLPLVYKNFQALGIDDPLMSRLKGIVRNTWTRNQLLIKSVSPTMQALNKAHIRTLLLGTAALTLASYADFGVAPMQAFDIAVPSENSNGAISAIVKAGEWTPNILSFTRDKKRLKKLAQIKFHNKSGHLLNLKWHIPIQHLGNEAESDFWTKVIPFQFHNVNTSILCPANQILSVIMDGLLYSRSLAVDWIAHAVRILKDLSNNDWQSLITIAQKHHLVLAVRQTLNYATQAFDVHIPLTQQKILENSTFSQFEHKEWKATTSARSGSGARYHRLRRLWYGYRRMNPGPRWDRLNPMYFVTFYRYLKQQYFGDT